MKFEYRNAVLSRGTWFKGFDLKSSAQEDLDKHLWATKQLKKAKTEVFPCLNPDTPGIGPDTPDPFARSVRVTVHGLKIRVARSLWAYTRSLRVTFRPTAISWVRGINTPLISFSWPSLAILTSWTHSKAKKSSLTPLSPFLSDSSEVFEWEASKSKDSC